MRKKIMRTGSQLRTVPAFSYCFTVPLLTMIDQTASISCIDVLIFCNIVDSGSLVVCDSSSY